MSIYVLPALVALVIKIYVLVIAHTARTTQVYSRMVLVFALHNLTEVISYIQFLQGSMPELLFRVYYAATMVMLYYMCVYAIAVTRIPFLKKLHVPLTLWVASGAVIAIGTDWLIAGFKPIGYSITAIQGPYYWMFGLSTLAALVFVTGTLVLGYRRSEEHKVQVQCLYNLAALSPVVILGFVIIPLLLTGQEINAAVVLPICTTLFLLITLQSEAKHRFTDIRRYLPFSREREMNTQVMSLISQFSMDQISYKEMSEQIEKIAIQHKLALSGDSISEAARRLKMKRTTLYSMLDRHGIKRGAQNSD